MNRTPVSSSNLASVGYDKASRTLEVEFHRSGVYQFSGIHPNTHRHLMSAGSKGKFFHKNIRDSYPYEKLGK